MIEKHCTDTTACPMFGTLYRVKIRSVWQGTVEAMVREELNEGRQHKAGSARSSGSAGAGATPPPPPGEVDPKAAAKQAAKAVKATKSLAKKVIARVGPVHIALSGALGRKDLLPFVPPFARDPATVSLQKLTKFFDAAKDAHVADDPRPLHFTTEEAETAAKEGSAAYALLQNMLTTAEKHAVV